MEGKRCQYQVIWHRWAGRWRYSYWSPAYLVPKVMALEGHIWQSQYGRSRNRPEDITGRLRGPVVLKLWPSPTGRPLLRNATNPYLLSGVAYRSDWKQAISVSNYGRLPLKSFNRAKGCRYERPYPQSSSDSGGYLNAAISLANGNERLEQKERAGAGREQLALNFRKGGKFVKDACLVSEFRLSLNDYFSSGGQISGRADWLDALERFNVSIDCVDGSMIGLTTAPHYTPPQALHSKTLRVAQQIPNIRREQRQWE